MANACMQHVVIAITTEGPDMATYSALKHYLDPQVQGFHSKNQGITADANWESEDSGTRNNITNITNDIAWLMMFNVVCVMHLWPCEHSCIAGGASFRPFSHATFFSKLQRRSSSDRYLSSCSYLAQFPPRTYWIRWISSPPNLMVKREKREVKHVKFQSSHGQLSPGSGMMEETWWNMPTSSSLYHFISMHQLFQTWYAVHMPYVTVTSAHSHSVNWFLSSYPSSHDHGSRTWPYCKGNLNFHDRGRKSTVCPHATWHLNDDDCGAHIGLLLLQYLTVSIQ